MTTVKSKLIVGSSSVVEAYRLDRYDNISFTQKLHEEQVVEAYRLDRYDNFEPSSHTSCATL